MRPPSILMTILLVGVMSTPPPAVAAPYAGNLCGIIVTNDESGIVNADPGHYDGFVDGGPWLTADPAVRAVTIECTIRVVRDDTVEETIIANTTDGQIGYLPPTTTSVQTDPQSTYLCTTILYTTDAGTTVGYRTEPCPAVLVVPHVVGDLLVSGAVVAGT